MRCNRCNASVSSITVPSAPRGEPIKMGFGKEWNPSGVLRGNSLEAPAKNARILLANLHPSSRRTFSCESFLNFLAFKEGILDTQISAPGGWPTVSARYRGSRSSVQQPHRPVSRNSIHLQRADNPSPTHIAGRLSTLLPRFCR